MASKTLLDKIKIHIDKTNYYNKTDEERLKDNEKCIMELSKIEKDNYYTGKKYLDY